MTGKLVESASCYLDNQSKSDGRIITTGSGEDVLSKQETRHDNYYLSNFIEWDDCELTKINV